jgi:hypothetical protein
MSQGRWRLAVSVTHRPVCASFKELLHCWIVYDFGKMVLHNLCIFDHYCQHNTCKV